jgi:hypothetical protein
VSRRALVWLTAVALPLGLASCGGGDAPSPSEYAQDAEEICRDAERRLRDASEGVGSADQVADAVDTVIEETRSSIDELRELEVPDGEAGERARRFVDALESEVEEKGIPALEDLRDALEKGDRRAAQRAVQRLQDIERSDADRLARDAGAHACVDN